MAFTVQPKTSKAEASQAIKTALLSVCDQDIQAAFMPHGYTIEPLLLQLIREIRKLGETTYEHNRQSPTGPVSTPSDATRNNFATDQRESGAETQVLGSRRR